MKIVSCDDLKIGDWIVTKDLENGKFKGKFKVARVSKIEFDNFEEIDLNKGEIEIIGNGVVDTSGGVINVLNKKEMKVLNILRTKLKMIKGLEDDTIKRKRTY